MPGLEPIDLHHNGAARTVASYVVETDDGPALFDCGPSVTIEALKAGLAAHGLKLAEIRHLLLSHIHFDHAGAAGVLVREQPALQVHVSEIGAPHLVDPSRLEASARRLFGDAFDTLWGELAPVPAENVRVVGERVLGLYCFPTPGHASHHVSYLAGDGTLYAGDAAGVRILPGRTVLPPTPPPEVDVELWLASLDKLAEHDPVPSTLGLTHFGRVPDVLDSIEAAKNELRRLADLARNGDQEEFMTDFERQLENVPPDIAESLVNALPIEFNYAGLERYWSKKAAAAADESV